MFASHTVFEGHPQFFAITVCLRLYGVVILLNCFVVVMQAAIVNSQTLEEVARLEQVLLLGKMHF